MMKGIVAGVSKRPEAARDVLNDILQFVSDEAIKAIDSTDPAERTLRLMLMFDAVKTSERIVEVELMAQ